jgi:phosphate:Na+ symporter
VNTIGGVVAFFLLVPFMKLVLLISPIHDTARQIANAHTIFNVLTTVVFLPFIAQVARLTNYFIFGEKKERSELYYLEKTSLNDTGTALDQVKIALVEISTIASQLMKHVSAAVLTLNQKHLGVVSGLSDKIERYQSRISEYLEAVMSRRLTPEESQKIPRYVRVLHEVERIRDYELKIKAVVAHLQSEGRDFHSAEKREIKEFFIDVQNLLGKTCDVIASEKKKSAIEIIAVYESISANKENLRFRSRKRLIAHRTGIATANYYYDVISSLEEIAKKCRNIARAMIE